MSKVAITVSLLDDLAEAISEKTGDTLPLTISDMTDIIEGLIDGNDLSYGYTDGTLPMAGVGKVGSAVI